MATKVCTYSIHDDAPKIFGSVRNPSYWVIKVWSTNDIERVEVELRNLQKALLTELNEMVFDELTKCLAELSPVTDGGFEVYYIRKK